MINNIETIEGIESLNDQIIDEDILIKFDGAVSQLTDEIRNLKYHRWVDK